MTKPAPSTSASGSALKPVFLLIEDDAVDAEAFRRAVKASQIDCEVFHAVEGAAGLTALGEILRERNDSRVLVFLDLNMPGLNGHDFLTEVRSAPGLRGLTIFILTTSKHQRDIELAYQRNVAGYFVKNDLKALLRMAADYVAQVEFPLLSR